MTPNKVNSILELVGNTPLIRVNRMNPVAGVELLVKLESMNPGGSVKDRIALKMIEMAEAVDYLHKIRVQEEWVKSAINGAPLEESMIEKLDHAVERGETVAVITPLGGLVGFHTVLRSSPFYSKPRRIM